MKTFKFAAAAAAMTLPLICLSAPAGAATAHNSQAGSFGASSSAGDSTPASPRVKHSMKHMAKHKKI